MNNLDKPVCLTLIRNRFDNDISNVTQTSWGDLVSAFSEWDLTLDKADSMLAIYGEFKQVCRCEEVVSGIHRCADNLVGMDILPLDFDGGLTIVEAEERFKDYEYLIFSSYSHRTEAKQYKDCFRILIPLKDRIPNEEYLMRKKALLKFVGGGIDKSSFDRARGHAIPCYHPERKDLRYMKLHEGQELDWTLYEREEVYIPPVQPIQLEDSKKQTIKEQLKTIHLGYDPDWYQVMIAMKGEGYTVEDFIEVTMAGMMKSKTVEDCRRKWQRSSKKGNGGFLINLIREKSEPDFMKKQALKTKLY